jgi:chemotaxis protein methyltransferase CheR
MTILDTQYQLFRGLILERTGMSFGPRRHDALAGGVLTAAKRADCENLEKYYRLLQGARTDNELWDDLIGTITVGETYFFRNPAHFEALRQHVLHDLIARHRDEHRLRIWSAGCSTGEEPYSIAILLRQLLPDLADWNVLILATDINKQSLRQARQGRYREWSFRQTDQAVRDLYFTPQGDLFELIPQVREMVTFAYLNLAEDAYPSLATNTNAMHLIVCRNVAIYLPEAVTGEIAERFHRCLVTDGWLMVGASETNSMIYNQFAAKNLGGATLYQKAAAPVQQPLTTTPHIRPTVQSLPVAVSLAPPPESLDLSFDLAFHFDQAQGGPQDIAQDRIQDLPVEEPALSSAEGPPQPSGEPVELLSDPYQEGLGLLGQGRYEEARACFLDCIARDPELALAYYQMARVHANRGQLKEARSWCQQAIERDPLLTEAHYILALIHQEEGTLHEAVARLKKTLYLDADFILARFSLSNLYQQVGRRNEAARHRAQAIRLAAKMPPDDVVPGSDDLTAGRLLTMVRATM